MQWMFVSFEGIDGSGKSSQAALLVERLRVSGIEVVASREPGGTALGERVRELLLGANDVAPWAEVTLFAAARAQLVSEVVLPALERDAWVVVDRFLDSSLAYQGGGRGLGVDAVLELNRAAIGDVLPDRTFLLQVPVENALARIGEGRLDRIEAEGAEFLETVASEFDRLAVRFDRIQTIDGTRSEGEIAEEIAGSLCLL
jgi:dTMP kinase